MSVEIRNALRADASALAAIYNHYIIHTPTTFDIEPVSTENREAWIADHAGGRHRGLVALEGEEVVAYASSGQWRPRAAYRTSVETSVYCAPSACGRGIGSLLYAALFDALKGEDIHRVYAGITMPNPASFALHARFGFRQVAHFTEQGRKFDRYWDVAWFERPFPNIMD